MPATQETRTSGTYAQAGTPAFTQGRDAFGRMTFGTTGPFRIVFGISKLNFGSEQQEISKRDHEKFTESDI